MQRDKILFAVLDWGLGHASRSVSLIEKLITDGHDVVVASAGNALNFLRRRFPGMIVIEKPGYDISYSRSLPMSLAMLLQLPKLKNVIHSEYGWTQDQLSKEEFNRIISDNCYGVRSNKAHSTLITHQLMLKCPKSFRFTEGLMHRQILRLIEPFDDCLIPDHEGENNLSGDLSHKYPLPENVKFIGAQSRFQKGHESHIKFDVCVLLSGPEPHRTILEDKLISIFSETDLRAVIIRGLPGQSPLKQDRNIEFFSHADDEELQEIISSSKLLVCRSGYSTLMDLHVIGRKALLIPTPGQTEQEYLAAYHVEKYEFMSVRQENLNAEVILDAYEKMRSIRSDDHLICPDGVATV